MKMLMSRIIPSTSKGPAFAIAIPYLSRAGPHAAPHVAAIVTEVSRHARPAGRQPHEDCTLATLRYRLRWVALWLALDAEPRKVTRVLIYGQHGLQQALVQHQVCVRW